MRVLIVHNSYQQAGGEDTAVANEHALLEKHGWETRLWSVTNDVIAGTWSKITAAMHATYSRPAREELARLIAEFRPAVVHVHNFFPLLSPSVYDACRAAGVAVVQTLHNYRTICAGALLIRDGHPCEDCIGGVSLPGRTPWLLPRLPHRLLGGGEDGRHPPPPGDLVPQGRPLHRVVGVR